MANKNLEIKELNTQIGQVVIPDATIKRLEEKEIKTLKDIRRKGGIPRFDDLPPEEEKAVKKVEAHAYISLVSDDLKINDTLIDTDFRNTADIARLTRNDFVVKAKEAGINADIASAIHAKSTAASAVFNNVLTASRVELANNFKVAPAVDIQDTFPAQCECRECESAVSPLAYLTDLLDYTITHVKKSTDYPIDLNTLEEEFHQPFKRYIAACEEVDRKVRQVRICIEVLRSHLKDDSPYTSYLFEAYKTLLNRIGTSYDEIRLARTAAPDKREALANRLGIGLSKERPDELDALFLTYENITEQDMEKLFGLVDTTRDPLSDGAKLDDVQDQITHWNLTGVEWNKNTDADGNIYVRLKQVIFPDRIPRVYSLLYRDRKRKQLVAGGLVRNGVGTIELKERNNSGLSGNFEIEYTADTNEVEISVIPDFLSWRLKHLRTLWKEQDWPGDPYTQRILPIIDPDVIGPDDFRFPEQNESVFEPWKKRRDLVDNTMEQLDRDRKINGLEHILEHTLKQVLGDDPLPDLDALLKNLTKGDNLEDTEDQIRSMNLTVESFTRLMEIRTKHIRAENNYESEAVNDEERREVYSILTQALKNTWYADWIAEEQEKHVNLGPKQFWISLRQPKEGDWPPAHFVQQPVIDPERLNAEELPELLAGGYAVVIREARRARLDQIYEKLKAEQEERGFVAMLKLVYCRHHEQDLPFDLDKLEKNLHSTDPEVVATAKRIITNGLHMTVIAFKRLMSIEAKADDPDSEPTDEEWAEVYAILTSAFKLKREYPNWISQEEKLPLIEPDVLELSDLAEPTVGKRAIALWHARQAKVDRTYKNLKDTGRKAGLDAMLREALGEPDPENPLPHNLTELNENLKSGGSEKVNAATIKITNDLFMTVNDFTSLMEIKDKYADPNTPEKPTEKEWAEVTTILTQAQKAKREYPIWGEHDNDIVYWSALKAKLPRWLATQEARQQWQQALRNRSQAPIIDPDVIGEYDLKNLIDDDPAYKILLARSKWGEDQLDALKIARFQGWSSWGDPGNGEGQFNSPRGVAIDRSGNVYVADSKNHRIQKFDLSGGFIKEWGSQGAGDDQFDSPRGVAVDSSGNVYVADIRNNRIRKFDSDGTSICNWGYRGNGEGEFTHPRGVAVDGSGNVYVADTENHRIQKFDSDGTYISEWGNQGDEEREFQWPFGVAVDSSGNVYVADSNNRRIQKFDSDGTFICEWGSRGTGKREFEFPCGVVVAGDGNVYVADSSNHRIQKFDSDGTFIEKWGSFGTGKGQFNYPRGVAVDRSGKVCVADSENNRIQIAGLETFLNWGSFGKEEGQFDSPYGVAIDSSGKVYVADSSNHRIQKFDSDGNFIIKWGSRGTRKGRFIFPFGMGVDGSGNVFVADSINHRIQKFDSDGVFIKKWGSFGTGKGQFKYPRGVAVGSSGNVYVADSENNRIQKFDSDGRFIKKWGSFGTGKGQFEEPKGVAVDSSGKVYVADSRNYRIQKFDSKGNFIKKWGSPGHLKEGQFWLPHGVAVDGSENVYVADWGNDRIQKFDSDGRFIKKWGSWGTGQFENPGGVAVDGSEYMYVADTHNHRIRKFVLIPELEAIISSTLGISLKDLTDLAEERKQGNDISARLDQLSLSMAAFLYLLRIHDLLVNDAEIMDSEWGDVYSILVQVQKRRIFAEWRDEEKEKGIFMSSDFFVIPENEPEELHPWRASWEARRDWQDKLGSRIDQEKTVCAAMAEAVDACEEATLMLLRDGFVEASDAEENDITVKAKRLTEQLLIDCQIDACQKTTRISQAIITLQKLIFSLRTGQLEDSELELDPGVNFEEEWMWMSSYETWKAAVGVFLYPENILLPGLRRRQTPAFQELIKKLRQNRRLTPQKATDLAKEYEDYFKDICSLDSKAVVQTSSRVYVIAQGRFTKSLYIYSYDLEDTSANTQTFWEKIEGLENVVVESVVGATPYKIRQERYIYLFLKTKKDSTDELVFIKYDLDNGKWDSEPNPLELPTGIKEFSSVVKQGYG